MTPERYKSIQDHYKMAKWEGASLYYTMVGDCLDEIERLQSLTNTITPVCIYCFKKWKTIPVTDTETYTAMVPEILEHVSVCEKNPLVEKIGRLRRELKRFEFIFSNKRSKPFRVLYDIAHKALEE